MNDDLGMLLSGDEEATARSNEQVWNLFSQILVPLVILLSFVAVAEITRYQLITVVTEETNRNLQAKLDEMSTTAPGILAQRAEEQLIDAQKQRLLHALDQLIAEERSAKGLGLDGHLDSARVTLLGSQISDQDFRTLCQTIASVVAGEVAVAGGKVQRLDITGEHRAAPEYIHRLYDRVLAQANLPRRPDLPPPPLLSDPTVSIADFEIASRQSPAWPKSPEGSPNDATVTLSNRRYILNEIAVAALQIQNDVAELQRGVLERIYQALTADPDQLDMEGQRLAVEMQQPGLTPQEVAEKAHNFFRHINEELRDSLFDAQYPFLNATWEPLNRL